MFLTLRRIITTIALCGLLAQFAACTSTRFTPAGDVVSENPKKITQAPGVQVAGYVTRDGANHPFDGTVTLEGDSFVFHPTVSSEEEADTTAAARAKREPFRLPRAEVESLNSYHHSPLLLAIGACAALAAGLLWLGDSMSK
jgi:hypothetical protein